jgi:type IV pilus assembly protein PilW
MSRGFSLTEVLVAMLLMLVVTAAVLSAFRFQMFALKGQDVQLEMQEAARGVVDVMTREIRMAGYDPTCAKTVHGIADARPQLLQLQFDSNEDGAIGAGESVTYAYDATAGEIQRNVGGTSSALVSDMPQNALGLSYYDASGTVLTSSGTPAALTAAQRNMVRRVKITVMLQKPNPDPQNGSFMISRFVSNVELRNRFLNGGVACP